MTNSFLTKKDVEAIDDLQVKSFSFSEAVSHLGLDPSIDLAHADLSQVDFTDSDLTNFNFSNSNLKEAYGKNIKGLASVQVSGAVIDGSIFIRDERFKETTTRATDFEESFLSGAIATLNGYYRGINLRNTFASSSKPFTKIYLSFPIGERKIGLDVLDGEFNQFGQHYRATSDSSLWESAFPSDQFTDWINGFYWLFDLYSTQDAKAQEYAQGAVDTWIEIYGKHHPVTWKVDILCKRLFVWTSLWSDLLAGAESDIKAEIRKQQVLSQANFLAKRYNKTSLGISRLRAAGALVLTSLRVSDKEGSHLERHLDWLEEQVRSQIFLDGGHVTRSPEVTLQAAEILLITKILMQSGGIVPPSFLIKAIDRLIPFLATLRHKDGLLACFNGGGASFQGRVNSVINSAATQSKMFAYAPHSKYQIINLTKSTLILDFGAPAKFPFDYIEHHAPLAFELSTLSGRMVVNIGVSVENSTLNGKNNSASVAHSTLVIDRNSPSPRPSPKRVLDLLSFKKAHSEIKTHATRREQNAGIWLEAEHDGYESVYGVIHRRRFFSDRAGVDIRGEDRLFRRNIAMNPDDDVVPFEILFHFHPDCRLSLSQDKKSALIVVGGLEGWRFRTDNEALIILEDSVYLGDGNAPRRASRLVLKGKFHMNGSEAGDENLVRWSFRKLDD